MGFLNTIISEDLYDRDFVEKWTNASFLIRKDTGKAAARIRSSEGRLTGQFRGLGPRSKAGGCLGIREERHIASGNPRPALQRQLFSRSGGRHESRMQDRVGCVLRRSRPIPTRPGIGNHLGSQKGNPGRCPLLRRKQTCVDSLGLADRFHAGHHADGPGHHGPLVSHGQPGSPRRQRNRPQRLRMRFVRSAGRGRGHQALIQRSGSASGSAPTNTARSENSSGGLRPIRSWIRFSAENPTRSKPSGCRPAT